MRQGPNQRRSRGRGNGRRQNAPQRNQTFDSNGPDVRIRGNAFQVYEKYLALARDASVAGDRVAAENYLQHAEHYYRIIGLINEQNGEQRRPQGQNDYFGAPGEMDEDDGGEEPAEGEAAAAEGPPRAPAGA